MLVNGASKRNARQLTGKSSRNISINFRRADGWLAEGEQVRGENLRPRQRVKVYVLEVKLQPKGPRIQEDPVTGKKFIRKHKPVNTGFKIHNPTDW